eukprot:TRINITY_DN1043_c0_g1_i1.p2 TRINITY_DN1043_c0_g1~~TRINITY_DN1043_c0_g1_i1.p2  ORF type:complete len:125 (-),score=24.49 TRINITY_DN1043_c0_g1_i1:707-1081(-)
MLRRDWLGCSAAACEGSAVAQHAVYEMWHCYSRRHKALRGKRDPEACAVRTRPFMPPQVLWDTATIKKLEKDLPKLRVITVSRVSDLLSVNGSLARLGIQHLLEKGLVKKVCSGIYTRKLVLEE